MLEKKFESGTSKLNTLHFNHSATTTYAVHCTFINGFLILIRSIVDIVKIIDLYLEDSMSALLEI